MAVDPVVDHGQDLPMPEQRAIGFVDTKEQFDAVTQALKSGGYANSTIIALHGEDGIHMLERLKKSFFFGDGEDAVIKFALNELTIGHYALGIEVKDREDALRAVSLSKPHGGHSFGYFGTWVNERLTR